MRQAATESVGAIRGSAPKSGAPPPEPPKNVVPVRHSVGMDDVLHERVREIIESVPPGTVATYGDIAALAGAPSPRMVGAILAEDGHDLPWHRILRANGTPAPHLVHDQLERLRAEGVLADGQRVDLRKYRWKPDGEEDGPEGLF